MPNLPGARFQVWLLLPQLNEQRFEAEVGIGHSQPTQRGDTELTMISKECPLDARA